MMAVSLEELQQWYEEAKATCQTQYREITELKKQITELKLLRLFYCPKCGKQIAEKGS